MKHDEVPGDAVPPGFDPSAQIFWTLIAFGPLSPFASSSKETLAPSLSERYPSPVMPEKCTNRSRPPSSGVMKPKPFSSENHLTVPVPTENPTCRSARLAHAVQISTGRCARSQQAQTLYTDVPSPQP